MSIKKEPAPLAGSTKNSYNIGVQLFMKKQTHKKQKINHAKTFSSTGISIFAKTIQLKRKKQS